MKLGAPGDVHGDYASVRAIMHRHPDIHCWVWVGDLACASGAYEFPPSPLYWIYERLETHPASVSVADVLAGSD